MTSTYVSLQVLWVPWEPIPSPSFTRRTGVCPSAVRSAVDTLQSPPDGPTTLC